MKNLVTIFVAQIRDWQAPSLLLLLFGLRQERYVIKNPIARTLIVQILATSLLPDVVKLYSRTSIWCKRLFLLIFLSYINTMQYTYCMRTHPHQAIHIDSNLHPLYPLSGLLPLYGISNSQIWTKKGFESWHIITFLIFTINSDYYKIIIASKPILIQLNSTNYCVCWINLTHAEK